MVISPGNKSCTDCKHYSSYSCAGSIDEPPQEGWECEIEEENYGGIITELIDKHDLKAAIWCKCYDVQI